MKMAKLSLWCQAKTEGTGILKTRAGEWVGMVAPKKNPKAAFTGFKLATPHF